MVEVTQIDRDAAANAISEANESWSRYCDHIVAGEVDSDAYVQAFARHRQHRPEVSEAFPECIGRKRRGDRLSDGETMCAGCWDESGHDTKADNNIPAGHAVYWDAPNPEYGDCDPYCIRHAIEAAERDASWCGTCISNELDAEFQPEVRELEQPIPTIPSETVELDWLRIAKLAGEHGVRYRTNRGMAAFIAALSRGDHLQALGD